MDRTSEDRLWRAARQRVTDRFDPASKIPHMVPVLILRDPGRTTVWLKSLRNFSALNSPLLIFASITLPVNWFHASLSHPIRAASGKSRFVIGALVDGKGRSRIIPEQSGVELPLVHQISIERGMKGL